MTLIASLPAYRTETFRPGDRIDPPSTGGFRIDFDARKNHANWRISTELLGFTLRRSRWIREPVRFADKFYAISMRLTLEDTATDRCGCRRISAG
jgi:hypothetical protein